MATFETKRRAERKCLVREFTHLGGAYVYVYDIPSFRMSDHIEDVLNKRHRWSIPLRIDPKWVGCRVCLTLSFGTRQWQAWSVEDLQAHALHEIWKLFDDPNP